MRRLLRIGLILCSIGTLWLAGCGTPPPAEEPVTPTPTPTPTPIPIPPAPITEVIGNNQYTQEDFSVAADVAAADWRRGLKAFVISCRSIKSKPLWSEVCSKAQATSARNAESFFKENLVPWKITRLITDPRTGAIREERTDGLITGYYEPLLKAVKTKSDTHFTPILSTPEDLIVVDMDDVYPSLKGMKLRGKLQGRTLKAYDDRSQIVQRTDLDKYAIGWSDDPVAVFFLQIQGSGRLEFPDGSIVRVGFDDQNGRPYKAVGSWLVQQGYLQKHELSMQNIQKWAKEHPSRVNDLLDQNPSFVFFKPRDVTDPDEGPIGAQGLPLTPMASVAVDRREIPLGVPLLVGADQDNPPLHFIRPVVAQDTGGAIRGSLRFDFFWGFGDEAGIQAGKMKADSSAWLLLPKGAMPSDLK